MLSRKQKYYTLKVFSMFSVVRGYNILLLILAQYLAAIYIFSTSVTPKKVLTDTNLLLLVLASAAAIAAGYIINNFYDLEKDLINRPLKTLLDKKVSQHTKLFFYFFLNFLCLILASAVSFKAVVFFSLYIFSIWFYSHKLKKLPIVGNITSAILAIIPFFVLFIYYKNFETVIFLHAIFLFLLISMRELVKDLENIKGDLAQNYKTIPIVYGEKASKIMLTILGFITLIPIYFLTQNYQTGNMQYYFYSSILLLVTILVIVWNSSKKKQYLLAHNLLKLLILIGVLSIMFIDLKLLLPI